MEKPLWIVKDKDGNEVWATFHADYVVVIEMALQVLGYQLIWGDLEICPGCGVVNAFCVCPEPTESKDPAVKSMAAAEKKEVFHESDRRSGRQPNVEWRRRRTDHPGS